MASSPTTRTKRNADAGVYDAIQSVLKNHKFKRMMIFSLRSLSDLCVPPTVRYKENSVALIASDGFAALLAASGTYQGDDEVASLISKCFFGISEALKEEASDKVGYVEELKFSETVTAAVAHGTHDAAALTYYLDTLQNLKELKFKLDHARMAGGLIGSLDPRMKPGPCVKLMNALHEVAKDSAGAVSIADHDGIDKVLACVSKRDFSVVDNVTATSAALNIVKLCAQAGKSQPNHLESVINVMDAAAEKPSIQSSGAAALTAMVGPDELKKCLNILKTATEGSPERASALTTLSSMSYISSCADEIVRGGGVPMLCAAVAQSAASLSKGEVKVLKGLIGATRILATVGKSIDGRDVIIKSEGVQALCESIKTASDKNPEVLAACMNASTPLLGSDAALQVALKQDLIQHLINALKSQTKNPEAMKAAMACVAVIAQHESAADQLIAGGAVIAIGDAFVLPAFKDSACYKGNALQALNHLAKRPRATYDQLVKTIEKVATGLESVIELGEVAGPAIHLLHTVSQLDPKAITAMSSGPCVDITLSAMLAHSEPNNAIASEALDVLELIATPKDVDRTLQTLESAVGGARSQPAKCLRALAAVNGLSQIPRLTSVIAEKNASGIVVNGFSKWIEGNIFNDQGKIIKAGCACVHCLGSRSSDPVEKSAQDTVKATQLNGLKALREKQGDPNDNSLVDLALLTENLCATQRFQSVDGLVEELLRAMRKSADCRRAQIHFINSLNYIALWKDEGCQKIVESGALRSVMQYMNKVGMYADVQIAGLTLMNSVAQRGPKYCETLRASDAVPLVQGAGRRFANSPEVKSKVNSLLNYLVPDSEVERLIAEKMAEIDNAVRSGDALKIKAALGDINAATTSPEAAKIAARCDLGRIIDTVMSSDVMKKAKADDKCAIETELAISAKNLTQRRAGINNLQKHNGLAHLIAIWDNLRQQPSCEGGVGASMTAMRRLMKQDKNEPVVVAERAKLHTKLCKYAEDNADNGVVFAEAAATIAAMGNRKTVISTPEVRRFIGNLCEKIDSDMSSESLSRMVEALEGFLMDPDDEMMKIVVGKKTLNALYKVMENHHDDLTLLRRAQRCAEEIARKQNMRTMMKKGEAPKLETMGRVTRRVIKSHKTNDADACASALRLLNQACSPSDRQMLSDLNLLPEVEDLMSNFANNQELMQACAGFLGNLGADEFVKSYMRKIIDACNNKPPDYLKLIESLNGKLALYLAGDLDNPKESLAQAPECMDCLAKVMKENPKNGPLLASSAAVTRRMARKFKKDKDSPYGIKALQSKLMPAMVEILSMPIDKMENGQRPRKLLIDGFWTLADCAEHPGCRPALLSEIEKCKLLDQCNILLADYENDAEVVAAVLAFMAAVSKDSKGAELARSARTSPKSRRIGKPDVCFDVMNLMKRHRNNREVIENGYDFIGNMGLNCEQLPPSLSDKDFRKDLDNVSPTAYAAAANMRTRKKLIGKVPPEETIAALEKGNEEYIRILDDESLPEADKIEVAMALAEFTEAAAAAGMMADLKKMGALDALIDMYDNHNSNIPTVKRVLPALRKAAENDSDVSAKLTRQQLGPLLADLDALALEDPEVMVEALSLLKCLATEEGHGRVIAGVEGYKKLMDNVNACCEGIDHEEANEIRLLAESVRQAVDDDDPKRLTLVEIFQKWSASKDAGEILDCTQSQIVIKHFDFVADYTEEYSKEAHKDLQTELGREYEAGCRCYMLLHELESNTRPALEKNHENQVFLKAMAKQRNDYAAQCAVIVANEAVKWPDAVPLWIVTPNCASIVGDTLMKGRKINTSTDEEREVLLQPRMQLVERLATERTYFNNTECMAALIGLWDDYDAGKYSVELLKQVFKSMRKIVNDHWVGIILKNKVPARLIEVIDDKTARIDLLPDVLFLLAALASVPEIKTMIGELKGVEACLELLTRQMKQPKEGTAAVLTNDCLALSAITMGHGANLARFVSGKGLELNIQCMEQSMTGKMDFDVANAASLLMCNTCFKRDEMKELYGKKGACQAVMRTINKYDGSSDDKAFRCLGSMFKAIGNLALFTPNVEIFMEGHIEKTFAHLYQRSEQIPDQLVEYSLRTLSNLAMENTQSNMTRFGVCLPPIISMIKQGQRTSITMFTLAFDVLGALCRLPANAKQFLVEDGIPTSLRILNTYSDPYLYSNGIHVLGIQTTNPESVAELITSGVFDFITSLVESQISADELDADLVVSALRCVRRLLKTQTQVTQFVEAGGLDQVGMILHQSAEHSMMHMEACRVVLNCLALFPPPSPPPPQTRGMEDDWEGDIADEGVLSAAESLDRPPSPRSWESVGMTSDSVSRMIEGLCKILDREDNVRQNRVVRAALGLLAYFACEKVPDTVSAFYSGNVAVVCGKVFECMEKDPDLAKMACYVINNVAYSSEPELYIGLRKDKNMRKSLDVACQQLPSSGGYKSFCDLTLKLLNERSADPSRFNIHQQWEFPLELTLWDKDKYPNGVQDLPQEMKEDLRGGGKFKTIVGEKDREALHWKSSLDLALFNWRVAPNEGPWQHSVAISRICNISKGLQSQTLRRANEQGSATSKPRENECIVLSGPPTEDFPNGVEVSIMCGSKRHRDRFFDLLNEWREAAAFGF